MSLKNKIPGKEIKIKQSENKHNKCTTRQHGVIRYLRTSIIVFHMQCILLSLFHRISCTKQKIHHNYFMPRG